MVEFDTKSKTNPIDQPICEIWPYAVVSYSKIKNCCSVEIVSNRSISIWNKLEAILKTTCNNILRISSHSDPEIAASTKNRFAFKTIFEENVYLLFVACETKNNATTIDCNHLCNAFFWSQYSVSKLALNVTYNSKFVVIKAHVGTRHYLIGNLVKQLSFHMRARHFKKTWWMRRQYYSKQVMNINDIIATLCCLNQVRYKTIYCRSFAEISN